MWRCRLRLRHVKRAVRADLHRFKAFIEMQELETGAWRGVIEDGELIEEHDDDQDDESQSEFSRRFTRDRSGSHERGARNPRNS
jgi:hypothetical protein